MRGVSNIAARFWLPRVRRTLDRAVLGVAMTVALALLEWRLVRAKRRATGTPRRIPRPSRRS